MKMDLSETSTDIVDLVNENETREKIDFYNKLSNIFGSLEYYTRQLESKRILKSGYATKADIPPNVFEDFQTGFQIADSKSNAGRIYKLTYNGSINQFYLNNVPITKETWISIKDNHQDFDFTAVEIDDFQSWANNITTYLIQNYGNPDLSDVPSDLIGFMNLDKSYKYLKELEAFVNEYKDRAFMNFNIVDNPPLVEESSYRLNLIQESPSKEIVLRCYYDNQLGEEIQEYDCPLALSKSELETLLADTKIEWGTMCFDALEALYKLVSVEKVKQNTSILEIVSKDEIKSINGLSIPAGVLQKSDSTITINLTTSVSNLSTVLQSLLNNNNITLNIDLKE